MKKYIIDQNRTTVYEISKSICLDSVSIKNVNVISMNIPTFFHPNRHVILASYSEEIQAKCVFHDLLEFLSSQEDILFYLPEDEFQRLKSVSDGGGSDVE